MTFEDWTDVMYETIDAGFGWSWIYYLSFIFLTAFAFLNMIIGIVVKVLEDEHQRERDALNQAHEGSVEPNLYDIQRQLVELKALVEKR